MADPIMDLARSLKGAEDALQAMHAAVNRKGLGVCGIRLSALKSAVPAMDDLVKATRVLMGLSPSTHNEDRRCRIRDVVGAFFWMGESTKAGADYHGQVPAIVAKYATTAERDAALDCLRAATVPIGRLTEGVTIAHAMEHLRLQAERAGFETISDAVAFAASRKREEQRVRESMS